MGESIGSVSRSGSSGSMGPLHTVGDATPSQAETLVAILAEAVRSALEWETRHGRAEPPSLRAMMGVDRTLTGAISRRTLMPVPDEARQPDGGMDHERHP